MLKVLTPWQALLIDGPGGRILVVADLHIGFEYELAYLRISIPSQIAKMKSRLIKIIERERPDKLLLLGDVKHSVPQVMTQEWRDLFAFLEVLTRRVGSIEIVPGNHDGDIQKFIPQGIRVLPVQGLLIGKRKKVALLHGHTWPSPESFGADYIIMGHVHPVIHIVDRSGFRLVKQVWASFNCDMVRMTQSYLRYSGISARDPLKALKERFEVLVRNPKILLMPSFNEALGGLPINMVESDLLGPLFRSGGVNSGSGEVILLDGARLGTIDQLRLLQK